MATADWSIADTVGHVRSLSSLCAHLVRPDATPDPFPGVRETFLTATVNTVADLNRLLMKQLPERDLPTLAGQLRADIDRILRTTEDLDPAQPVPWLGGSRLPVIGLLAHMVNELLVHGRDIARTRGFAAGGRATVRWPVPRPDAALFYDVFLVELIRHGYGHLIDDAAPGPPRRIAVEFRSRYTSPITVVLDHGRVSVEEPGHNIDVHLYFDPAILSLVLFGSRISRTRAALTGKLVVWGRRPWLLAAFLRTVHMPS